MPAAVTPPRQKAKKRQHDLLTPPFEFHDEQDRGGPETVLPSIEFPPSPPDSVRPSEPRNRHKRPRDDGEEAFRPHKKRGSTSRHVLVREIITKDVDSTYLYDPYDVELPPSTACLPFFSRDQFGEYLPLTDRTKIDDTIRKPNACDLKFPNVLDDKRRMVPREFEKWVKKPIPRPKPARKGRSDRSKGRKKQTQAEDSDHSEIEVDVVMSDIGTGVVCGGGSAKKKVQKKEEPKVLDPWQLQQARGCGLFSLPLEIRQLIYREALVAEEPIPVHTDWRKIYQRKKAEVSIQILCVCKAIHTEALPILYGDNVFHYRIRDNCNAAATAANINHPALIAGNPGEEEADDDNDSDSDWEPDKAPSRSRKNQGGQRTTRSSARGQKSRDDSDIDVVKFAPFFKRLSIEAEANRYGEETQQRMAKAIEVFRGDQETDPDKRLKIHSLTIRVTPSVYSTVPHGYSFVDFFDQTSPVLQAARRVDCQLLRIEICCSVLDSSLSREACARGESLQTIDLRLGHQRVVYDVDKWGVKDIWAGDEIVQSQRMAGVQKGQLQFDELADRVREVCELHDDGTSEDLGPTLNPNSLFDETHVDYSAGNGGLDGELLSHADVVEQEEPEDDTTGGDHGETAEEALARIGAASLPETPTGGNIEIQATIINVLD